MSVVTWRVPFVAIVVLAGCRPTSPPVAPATAATPEPRAALVDRGWCQLAPMGFDEQWRSPRAAGPFAVALTGSQARPPWKSEVHVIDRQRWIRLEVDLDAGFVAGAGDDLYFGGRREAGNAFLVYRTKTSTWESLPADGMVSEGDAAWARETLLVWNGIVGAKYVAAEKRWRPMSSEGSAKRRLSKSFSAWSGRELVVANQSDFQHGKMSTEVYDPARDRWRAIETPFHYRFTGAVSDGNGSVWTVAGVVQPQGWQTQSLFRLGPAANAWEEVMPLPGSACDFIAAGIGFHAGKLFVFSDEGGACERDVATGATHAIDGLGYGGAEYIWIGDAMVAVRTLWEEPVETIGDMYRAPKPLSMTAFLFHPAGTPPAPVCAFPRGSERTHLGRLTPCPDRVHVRVTSGAGRDAERVRELVNRKVRELESCWSFGGSGPVELELLVAKPGVIEKANVNGETKLDACVQGRAERWRFPRLEADQINVAVRLECGP